MDEKLKRILQRQHYKIIGSHSGVKICHWMRQKLFYGRPCYKETFYGIESHRCLQMTPVIDRCTQNCFFCWRVGGFDIGSSYEDYDDPSGILEKSIKAQKPLISGFKGDERCDTKLWHEALQPNQVAISLTGEPTLYPKLGEFIEACHKNGMTTFLVTNGSAPKILERLNPLPTQLYVTVAAPNEEIFRRLCTPSHSKAWSYLNQTLELMPSLSTRTVIRHTLVEGWNLCNEEEYATLDEKAEPLFIEPKGFVFVGGARQRMTLDNMPTHERIKEFSEKLGHHLGYDLLMERSDSRVILLGENPNKCRIG